MSQDKRNCSGLLLLLFEVGGVTRQYFVGKKEKEIKTKISLGASPHSIEHKVTTSRVSINSYTLKKKKKNCVSNNNKKNEQNHTCSTSFSSLYPSSRILSAVLAIYVPRIFTASTSDDSRITSRYPSNLHPKKEINFEQESKGK